MALRSEYDVGIPGAGAVTAPAAEVDAAIGSGGVVLSTVPPSPREARLALAVVVISAVACAAAIPFARVQLSGVPSFIAAYETALIVNDAITALLLFGQFVQVRSRALYVLACGYLFDALVTVPHVLSFPGLFAPNGLIGGDSQSTGWLYMAWHGIFPLFVIAYAMLDDRDGSGRTAPHRGRAVVGPIAVAFLVGVVTLQVTAGIAALPVVVVDNRYTLAMTCVVTFVWALSVIALAMLWRKRARSVLDLWLMVVMCVWVFDVALSAVFDAARYDLGWYGGRAYGLLAGSFVLALLLLETSGLHSRLAEAATRLERRARRLETEQAQTEAQLRQAQKMEAIGNLTGGMAHDFNNLLGVIIGNLDMLQECKRGDAEVEELAGDALDAAQRGADLTRRLLAFARRQALQPRRIDLNDLVTDITRLLSRTLGETVEIALDLAPELWPVVADPAQLEASLTNLATNARDAMPGGGGLVIATANRRLDADYAGQHTDLAAGDYVMIEVSDTGGGIPPDILGKIFEPFYTTKELGKATGLGLSMVFGFMRQSGGHIDVYSEPGVGSIFRLYLPRAAADVDAPGGCPAAGRRRARREDPGGGGQ